LEVEQASRGLSAIADLLVSDCVAYRKIKLANNSRDASTEAKFHLFRRNTLRNMLTL